MQRTLYNPLILLMIALASGVFLFTVARSAFFVSDSNEVDTSLPPLSASATTSSITSSPVADPSAPIKIRIPKINVDATVVDVGVGRSGNMAVPYSYADAGWYRYGPMPGEVGSAVIDGHIDNGFGLPAVFARLTELQAGDDIYIETKAGNTLHFVVENAETYDVAEVPLERLFNQSDAARLNLVTCEGTWLPDAKMYNERHIVYAVLDS